jgi:hypothetical protein
MSQIKYALIGAGAIGVIAVFLPMVALGGESVSLWDMKQVDAGQTYLVLICFLATAGMGVKAHMAGVLAKKDSIIAAVAAGLAFVKCREMMDGAIGGKLLFLAGLVGLAAAIYGAVKPEGEEAAS